MEFECLSIIHDTEKALAAELREELLGRAPVKTQDPAQSLQNRVACASGQHVLSAICIASSACGKEVNTLPGFMGFAHHTGNSHPIVLQILTLSIILSPFELSSATPPDVDKGRDKMGVP